MKGLILFSLVVSLNMFAQTDCKHNVSTNIDYPTNDALPFVNSSYYLNGFDWLPTLDSTYDNYLTSNMSFAGVPLVYMNNIMTQAYPTYRYIWSGSNLKPTYINGWELLMVNLGRYPNDSTIIPVSTNSYSDKPFIVLYNRYSATIRVFVNYGLDHTVGNGANDMLISISFEDPDVLNGNLRLYGGYDSPLDKNSGTNTISSVVIAPAESENWASTDFKIAYDPCICYHPSRMRFDFSQIKVADISLYGREIELQDQSLLGGVLSDNVDSISNYLNSFDYTNGSLNADGSGLVMHKTLQNMIDNYYRVLKEYNKKLVEVGENNKVIKQNLAVLRMAKYVFKISTTAASGGLAMPSLAVLATNAEIKAQNETALLNVVLLGELYEGIDSSIQTISDMNWFNVVEELNKGIVKITGGVKKIDDEKLFDAVKTIFGDNGKAFIAQNFELEDAPTAPTIPTANFSEMKYVGTITEIQELAGFSFYTPGTYGTDSTEITYPQYHHEYPIYNEALGVFALLKSPKIKITNRVKDYETNLLQCSSFEIYNNSYNKINVQRYESWSQEYQFTLVEDLEYALNDVLDIEDYSIKASFDIIAKNIEAIVPSKKINSFVDPNYQVNILSTNFNSEVYDSVYARVEPYHYFSDNIDYEFLISNSPIIQAEYVKDNLKMNTPYLDINNFYPLVFSTGIKNEVISFSETYFAPYYIDNYPYINITNPPPYSVCDSIEYDLSNPLVSVPIVTTDLISTGSNLSFDINLKLIVDVKYSTLNTEGKNNKVTYILTYPITDDDIIYEQNSYIINDLANSNSNIFQFPVIKTFNSTNFNGQKVPDCSLNGSIYTCRAIEDIYINGDITVSNGYHVDFKAGNEIYVDNESNVSPECILQIQPVLDYSHPMSKATQTEVTTFCLDANEYNGNKPRSLIIDELSINQLSNLNNNDEIYKDIDFTLYPNPTNNTTSIIVNDMRNENLVIKLRDVSGKEVQIDVVQQNSNSYVLDVVNLESGIYFVTVSTYGGSKTKRLVVQ